MSNKKQNNSNTYKSIIFLVVGIVVGALSVFLILNANNDDTNKEKTEEVSKEQTDNNQNNSIITLDLSNSDLDYDYKSGVDMENYTEKLTLEELNEEFTKLIGKDLVYNAKQSKIGDNSNLFEELKGKETVLVSFDYKGEINQNEAKKAFDIVNAVLAPYKSVIIEYNRLGEEKFAARFVFEEGKIVNTGGETATPDPTELFTLSNQLTAHLVQK